MDKSIASSLFKALGDESRLKIVKILYKTDEICACKFLDFVSCGQATLSHHLSVLLKSDLIKQKRDGKKIMYSCNKSLINDLMNFFQKECECKGEIK